MGIKMFKESGRRRWLFSELFSYQAYTDKRITRVRKGGTFSPKIFWQLFERLHIGQRCIQGVPSEILQKGCSAKTLHFWPYIGVAKMCLRGNGSLFQFHLMWLHFLALKRILALSTWGQRCPVSELQSFDFVIFQMEHPVHMIIELFSRHSVAFFR